MQNRTTPTTLPVPSADELKRSATLADRLREKIQAAGGWISFAQFMEACLYTPRLGYYSSGAVKLGRGPRDGSDFVTAPELSPLFGRALARPIAQICAASAPQVFEFGAGSGVLAATLLSELERMDALPTRYTIIDLSADLRERQKLTIMQRVPHLLERVAWVDTLPEPMQGAILANEVLDAMPVHLMLRLQSDWLERGVAIDESGQFAFADHSAPATLATAMETRTDALNPLGDIYLTELNLAAPAWIASIADKLTAGGLLVIDYGFNAAEYFHPQRDRGTLMAHYRHRATEQVLQLPGLMDLTAHVDFSAIAAAAAASGLTLLGYTSQANFLINCGIAHLIEGDPADARAWLPQANALQRLISEAEMGELFKVIALGRGLSEAPIGFQRNDRSGQL